MNYHFDPLFPTAAQIYQPFASLQATTFRCALPQPVELHVAACPTPFLEFRKKFLSLVSRSRFDVAAHECAVQSRVPRDHRFNRKLLIDKMLR